MCLCIWVAVIPEASSASVDLPGIPELIVCHTPSCGSASWLFIPAWTYCIPAMVNIVQLVIVGATRVIDFALCKCWIIGLTLIILVHLSTLVS